MNNLRLTVKNYKHCEWMSEETDCYTASLYLDGKRIGTAENSGHGGCDMYNFATPAAEAAFKAYAEEWVNSDEVQNDPTHQINGECYASDESLVAQACLNFRRIKMMKGVLKNRKGTDFTTAILIERPVNNYMTDYLTLALHPHHDAGLILAEKAQDGDRVFIYTPEDGAKEYLANNGDGVFVRAAA